MRTRGWWTVEPSDVLGIVEKYGKLIIGEKGELMVEFPDQDSVESLSASLLERFDDQVFLCP